MDVPIDRSGSVPGTLPLLIERIPASQPTVGKAPIVFLSGGPGQSNTDLTTLFAPLVKSFAPDRDILSIALRGTGPSAIDCPALTLSGADTGSAIAACAAKLGPAHSFYTTRDRVDDIESVRAALGVPKLTLYGTSYGTYEAYAYAVRHPDAVESLVLDSTVAPEFLGDVFQTRVIHQLPVVARADCADARCKGITSDPWADLRKLGKRIRGKTITTHVYGPGGKRKTVTVTELGTLLQMFGFDVDPNLRAELPRALVAALHRDYVPLGRIVAQSRTQAGPAPDPRPAVNPGLYYAVACEEYDWPWDRSASPSDKFAQALKAVNVMPRSSFQPFGPQLAFQLSAASQCASWPQRPDPPTIGSGPPPDVPVLLIHGRFDARTGHPHALPALEDPRDPGDRALSDPPRHLGLRDPRRPRVPRRRDGRGLHEYGRPVLAARTRAPLAEGREGRERRGRRSRASDPGRRAHGAGRAAPDRRSRRIPANARVQGARRRHARRHLPWNGQRPEADARRLRPGRTCVRHGAAERHRRAQARGPRPWDAALRGRRHGARQARGPDGQGEVRPHAHQRVQRSDPDVRTAARAPLLAGTGYRFLTKRTIFSSNE
jgi:pimeloyl-ACP methyl ester carboxylesterase